MLHFGIAVLLFVLAFGLMFVVGMFAGDVLFKFVYAVVGLSKFYVCLLFENIHNCIRR